VGKSRISIEDRTFPSVLQAPRTAMLTPRDRVSHRTSMYVHKAINAILFTLKLLSDCGWPALIIRGAIKTYPFDISHNQGITSSPGHTGASLRDNE